MTAIYSWMAMMPALFAPALCSRVIQCCAEYKHYENDE